MPTKEKKMRKWFCTVLMTISSQLSNKVTIQHLIRVLRSLYVMSTNTLLLTDKVNLNVVTRFIKQVVSSVGMFEG